MLIVFFIHHQLMKILVLYLVKLLAQNTVISQMEILLFVQESKRGISTKKRRIIDSNLYEGIRKSKQEQLALKLGKYQARKPKIQLKLNPYW